MAVQQLLLLLPPPSRTFSKPLPTPPFPFPGLRLSSSSASAYAARRRDLLRCGMRRSDLVADLELAKDRQWQGRRPNGIFWILLLNVGIYVADHLVQDHQFIVNNAGKLVEEEEGSFTLWMSYILTGAGSNLISWLVLPITSMSLGASGAVFGLFTISVLVKMSWDWRKILEVLILGQFVVDKVTEAARATTVTGHSLQVNNIAHLSGALIGAALVLLINRIPFRSDGDSPKSSKDTREKRS